MSIVRIRRLVDSGSERKCRQGPSHCGGGAMSQWVLDVPVGVGKHSGELSVCLGISHTLSNPSVKPRVVPKGLNNIVSPRDAKKPSWMHAPCSSCTILHPHPSAGCCTEALKTRRLNCDIKHAEPRPVSMHQSHKRVVQRWISILLAQDRPP